MNLSSMNAVSLEIQHDCVIGNMSRELQDTRVAQWCLNQADLYQVLGPGNEVEMFKQFVSEQFGIRYETQLEGGCALLSRVDCVTSDPLQSVTPIIEEMGLWNVPPIRYWRGWESWRVLSLDPVSLREAVERILEMGEIKITSIRPMENDPIERIMLVPVSDIILGLTSRQASLLARSLDRGYYSVPSETSIASLARETGLSRSTFGEHLRKAQSRILSNLRPYLSGFR